jgi:hypothetical protein
MAPRRFSHYHTGCYLNLFTTSFQRLAKGVDMYCHELKTREKVFAFSHTIYGYLPGQCSIAGLKYGTMALRLELRCCSICTIKSTQVTQAT